MRLPIFPADDPAQKLRIKRFLMSISMYVLFTIPLYLAVYLGIAPAFVAINWTLLALFGNGIFYLIFRINTNKRFRDPSLTVAQMSVAIGTVLYVQIYAGPVRGAFLFGLLIIFVFGCFKLNTARLLLMSSISTALYAATIPLMRAVDPEHFNLNTELVLCTAFSAFLPFLSVLTGSISKMRRQLAASRVELQGMLKQVTAQAAHDELTGAYSRRWLLDMLAHEKGRTDRNGDAFCVCLADLDHFKRVNDTYGHLAGDIVLKSFADIAATMVRDTDILARYGGEEFILFMPQSSLETAQRCMERIAGKLASTTFDGLRPELRITMSVGIARYLSTESIPALIERADQALYCAKQGGRNKVELAHEVAKAVVNQVAHEVVEAITSER